MLIVEIIYPFYKNTSFEFMYLLNEVKGCFFEIKKGHSL
jgi:hypothetical protein